MKNHDVPALRWTMDPCTRHLNHGSFGAVPEAVLDEQARLRRIMEWNPVRWFSTLPERVAEARIDMAHLLGVDPETMAFVLNASGGATAVYDALVGPDPVTVQVTNHGYGAVTMGAERLARRTGGRMITTRIPLAASADEVVDLVIQDMEAAQPTLLVIDHLTSATARAFPVDRICDLARERGVLTLVDGAHAPAILSDPLCRTADFWVGNLHKFACAPRGAAVLVARNPDSRLQPNIDSWGAKDPFPERFDYLGTLDTTAWLTAPFAWRHIDEHHGWDRFRTESSQLAQRAAELVADALGTGVPDVGQPIGPLRLVELPEPMGMSREEADALRVPFSDQTGIALAFTSFEQKGYLRLSAHIYNTIDDYQYLASTGVPLLRRWAEDIRRGNP